MSYDVFVSLAGPDRPAVRDLVDALKDAKLQVFLDEEDIPQYHGITAEIERALHESKTLLAYYSRHFAGRAACQYELTAAFLAGQRQGDPTARIMVLNPHGETDHLVPVELAEDRFDRLPAVSDRASMARLVARIKAKVAGVDGYIGGVPFTDAPTWYGRRVPGAHGFVGRYGELWALHSALHRHKYGLTQDTVSGGVAVLSGMPGIGKSELAAAYAWRFGSAHLGGVYWVSLIGTDSGQVRASLADALRDLAMLDAAHLRGASADEVIAAFAGRVSRGTEPSLLVVDDIPTELDADVVTALTVPAGRRLYTVLVTNRPALGSRASVVPVGGMSLEDSVALLRRYRAGSVLDVTRLAERLDGHPFALTLAGRRLRDREGLVSYSDFVARLDGDPPTRHRFTSLLRERILALDEPARRALYLATMCSPAAIPAALLERVLGADSEAAVIGLRDQLVATRLDSAWQVHTLVRDAAHEYLPEPKWTTLAVEAARAVLDLRGLDPTDTSLVVRHAGHLSARSDLPADLTDALLYLVVEHYDERGEPVLALPFHTRLADLHPDDSAVLVRAARCHQLTGAPEAAYGYASHGLTLATDPVVRRAALRWAAQALDARAAYTDADPLWTELLIDPGNDPTEFDLAYAHALRQRGRHAEAKQRLTALATRLGDDEAVFHLAQAVQLELARVEIDTDSQGAARRRAYAVLSAYRVRALAYHVNAAEAGRVYAEARLALALTDLSTDPRTWHDAARDLQELRDGYESTHGPRNLFTLDTAVAYALALTALGKPGDARRAIEAVQEDLLAALGERHPTYLQARMVLGFAAAQCGHNDLARRYFTEAYEGQREVLGQTHPATLRSQLGLGVALKLTGDSAQAARMFTAVRRAAPTSVGRRTDLFGQAFTASVLRWLPSPVWRMLSTAHKSEEEC